MHLRWHKRISATSGEAESVNHLEVREQADGGEVWPASWTGWCAAGR